MIICFFPKFPTFQVMQQFFSSRVCCDFCESFGREMSLNDAKVNSSSDVKSSVKRWDYFGPRWIKNPLHGFRFQQAGGPQESTCEEESDFQAKSCESLYQWIIRVFTTCFWFCHFGVVCSCWFGILGLGILAILTLVALVLVWWKQMPKNWDWFCEGNILDSQIPARSCD